MEEGMKVNKEKPKHYRSQKSVLTESYRSFFFYKKKKKAWQIFLGGGLDKGDIVYLSAQTTVEGCGEVSLLAGG